MKSKEKVLRECEHDGSFIPVNEVKKAMNEHARNCMIEFHKWYFNYKICEDSEREKIVDGFLSSNYFKEIQEP